MTAPSPLKYKRYQDCPDAARLHSEPPRNMNENGYSPTKKQVRCPSCGFWSMWVPRTKMISNMADSRPETTPPPPSEDRFRA